MILQPNWCTTLFWTTTIFPTIAELKFFFFSNWSTAYKTGKILGYFSEIRFFLSIQVAVLLNKYIPNRTYILEKSRNPKKIDGWLFDSVGQNNDLQGIKFRSRSQWPIAGVEWKSRLKWAWNMISIRFKSQWPWKDIPSLEDFHFPLSLRLQWPWKFIECRSKS